MQLPQTFEEFDQTMRQLSSKGVPKQDQQRFAETWKFKMQQQGKDPMQMHQEWLATPKKPLGPEIPKEIAEQRAKEPEKKQPISMIATPEEYEQRSRDAMTLTPEKMEQARKNFPLAKDISSAVKNIPRNTKEIVKGSLDTVLNPIESIKSIARVSSGGFATGLRALGVSDEFLNKYNKASSYLYSPAEFKVSPGGVKKETTPVDNEQMFEELRTVVAETLKDPEKLKQAAINNPVDVALLFTSLLTGTRLGSKISEVAQAGKKKAGLLLDEAGTSVQQGVQAVEETIQGGVDKLKQLPAAVDGSAQAAKQAVVQRGQAVKEMVTGKPETPEKIAGKIVQGTLEDKARAAKALSEIDTKDVKTYGDLEKKFDEKVSELAKDQDLKFDADPTPIALDDLVKVDKVGDRTIKTNYVEKALDQLQEMYGKIEDPVNEQRLTNLKIKAMEEGLTRKEVNQVAREYGTKFKSKAFGKNGEALTSVNAQAFENVRTGVKETARDFMPDDATKELDSRISDVINARELVAEVNEKANKLAQRIEDRGLLGEIGRKTERVINQFTLGLSRGFLRSLLTESGRGFKSLNSLDLQERLPKLLQSFDKALKAKSDGQLDTALDEIQGLIAVPTGK